MDSPRYVLDVIIESYELDYDIKDSQKNSIMTSRTYLGRSKNARARVVARNRCADTNGLVAFCHPGMFRLQS